MSRRHSALVGRRQQALMLREEHTLRKMAPLEEFRPQHFPAGLVPTKVHLAGDNSNENEYAYVWDSPQQQQQTATGTLTTLPPRKSSDPGLPLQRGTLLRNCHDTRSPHHVHCFEMDDARLESKKAPYPL